MSINMKFELLPNELLILCFQYLETSDIICSFDQLNYRFSQLIRNIPLHIFSNRLNQFLFPIYETMLITSLSLINCNIYDLFQSFKYILTLEYCRLEYLYDDNRNDEWIFIDINTINLKQFIINDCQIKFKFLQFLLNKMTNLKLFSISSSRIEMIDANIWQSIIEYSLINLQIFQFCFHYNDIDSYDEKFIKIQSFQTQFWSQHKWNINYEISRYSLLIYTTPFIRKEYKLDLNMDKSVRIYNYLNLFDNVMDLTICTGSIKKKLYFRNIISLTISCSSAGRTLKYINDLHRIVNTSKVKHLRIEDNFCSSLFLQLLNELPNIDSLMIKKSGLLKLLYNDELCELFNKKIIRLNISKNYDLNFYNTNSHSKICSNIQPFKYDIEKIPDLEFILSKCSKLSMIKLGNINYEIYLWIQVNRSTFNIDFDFTLINIPDNITTAKSSQSDLVMDLFC